MTPDLQRFLDLATRPLEAEPGTRDEAKGELMARVGHAGVPYDMLDLSAPLERLEATPPRKPWPRRIALLAALAVSIATLATSVTLQTRDFAIMTLAQSMAFSSRMGGGAFVSENPLFADHVRRRAPDLPLGPAILAGGDGETEPALWLARHPEDLAMLQEQVTRRLQPHPGGTGPSDQEKELIDRLDAGNALWPLLQVGPRINASGITPSYMRSGPVTAGKIKEAEFQNALRLFSEAAAKTVYIDRSLSLRRMQVDAFRKSATLVDDMVAGGFAGMVSDPFPSYYNYFESLAELHCERLVKEGNKEGLLQFFGEWKKIADLLANSPAPLDPGNSGFATQIQMMARPLADAMGRLGMPLEKAEVEERQKSLLGTRHSLGSAPPEVEAMAGLRINALSILPRNLTPEEMLPSKRTELAFFDRMMGTFLAVLALLFTGLVALETCRRSRIVKGMARGLGPLFQKRDCLWIAGLGLAFPWFWWWAVTRVSPLGMRDLKFDEWYVLTWVLQPIAAFIFGVVMLLQTARWRWGRQGGFLSLGASLPWLGWIAAALCGLALPASGILRYLTLTDDQTGMFLVGVFSMSGCGLLWLLWEGIMNLFTPRSSALRPNLVMRALLPWAFAGVLTLLASVAVSNRMERHWFLKDPLLPTWTSKTHLNALEERAAAEWKASMQKP